MMKQIAQYFFGTESHKFYNNHRSFYREFLSDSKAIQGAVKSLNTREALDIGISKVIPSLIDMASVVLACGFREPLYLTGIGLGETVRLFSSGIFSTERESMEANRLSVYTMDTIRGDMGLNPAREKIPNIAEICVESEKFQRQIRDRLETQN